MDFCPLTKVLISLTEYGVETSATCSTQYNSNLPSWTSATEDQCKSLCNANSYCVGFVYEASIGRCDFKGPDCRNNLETNDDTTLYLKGKFLFVLFTFRCILRG